MEEQKHKTKEDLTAVLENLEQMFICQRHCVNETAKSSMLVSLGVEAQFLALKLELMQARWSNYMPLREMVGFDYEAWIKKVRQWIEIIEEDCTTDMPKEYSEFIPSCEYLFDYYVLLQDEGIHFYDKHPDKDIQDDTKQFVQKVGHIIKYKRINDDTLWITVPCSKSNEQLEKALQSHYDALRDGQLSSLDDVRLRISQLFRSLQSDEDCSECCLIALGNLLTHLLSLYETTTSNRPAEDFARVSIRQYYHLCLEHHRKAINQVIEWKKAWPDSKVKEYAMAEKEKVKDCLLGEWYGKELAEYINLDMPTFVNSVEFGRFLYKHRNELTFDDIYSIHYHCRLITQLNVHINVPAVQQEAPAKHLFKGTREETVWKKILKLIHNSKASWNQITEKQVEHIMAMALGIGHTLPNARLQEMSEKLWGLFFSRTRCNEERSHMVTWLNIAGFFRYKGYLSSKDSAICHEFYPSINDNTTYNNVQKGRTGTQKNFQEVVELLEYCCEKVVGVGN